MVRFGINSPLIYGISSQKSARVDIPVQALNLYFNGSSNLIFLLDKDADLLSVTNPVVSQVNPHVHLFFFASRGSAGKPVAHRKGKGKICKPLSLVCNINSEYYKGWRGNFLLSAGEQWLKHELTKNFKVIRDLELLPQLLGQDWSSVFLQRFEGAITYVNSNHFRWHVLLHLFP